MNIPKTIAMKARIRRKGTVSEAGGAPAGAFRVAVAMLAYLSSGVSSRARCGTKCCCADTGPSSERGALTAAGADHISSCGPASAQQHFLPQRVRDDPLHQWRFT